MKATYDERTNWRLILPAYLALFLVGSLAGWASGYTRGISETHANTVRAQKLNACYRALKPFMEPEVYCWRIK